MSINYNTEFGCLFWIIPFLVLAVYSIVNSSYVLVAISILVIIFIVKQVYAWHTESKKFNGWMTDNDKTIIFFYPTKRANQKLIKAQFENKLKPEIKQMFYDKSRIVGDIKNQVFIKFGLSQLNRLHPKHPRLIQINGNALVELINLSELNDIDKLGNNRVDEIINKINNFA